MALRPCRILLAALLAAAPLLAQEEAGFPADLKVRMAWTPSPKDHLSGTSLGLGLAFPFQTAAGTLALEVGYYYKTGDDYYPAPLPGPAGLQPLDAANSGESARNQLDGFSVRLSLQRRLTESWDWQAGIMVGGTRFRHEYHGQVQSLNWDADHPDAWLDFYDGAKVQGGWTVSPYVGLVWAMTERTALEFSLMALSYKAVEYVHLPGTGTYAFSPVGNASNGPIAAVNAFPADTFRTASRYVPHAEFGFSFHF